MNKSDDRDELCVCGHPKRKHVRLNGYCFSYECKCSKFLVLLKILVVLLLLIGTVPVHVAVPTDCELKAKQYQQIHNGSMIFIHPVEESGAFVTGDYSGHWINRAYTKTWGIYYFDPSTDTFFGNSTEYIRDVFYRHWGKNIQMWDVNNGEHPPFPLIHHY